MKKAFVKILFISLLFSCGKWPVNGKLDGRWQLIQIEYRDDTSILVPEFVYYDFQLDLLHLARTQGEEYKEVKAWARFNHQNDSLHIYMINGNEYYANLFGLGDTIQHFEIVDLTKKRMELNSEYAKLIFRKF